MDTVEGAGVVRIVEGAGVVRTVEGAGVVCTVVVVVVVVVEDKAVLHNVPYLKFVLSSQAEINTLLKLNKEIRLTQCQLVYVYNMSFN